MKGPFERLKYDLRRLFECPVCQRRERHAGHVTTALCPCQQEEPIARQQWMRLVDDRIRRVL